MKRHVPDVLAGLGCKGRLGLTLHDADSGLVVARRRANNLIVSNGLATLARALNYGLVYAENASWSNPYSPPVGAMYGAVGLSSTPVDASQTTMVAEIGRALVSNSAVAAEVLSYDFFFPTSLGNGVIQEVGTLSNAGLLTVALTASLNAGTTYTSLAVTGLTGSLGFGAALVIGYGTSTTVTVTTTSPVDVGATSIPVTDFTPAAAFAAGALVANIPGTLIDRAVLDSPVTKTAAQTMTLNLSLTLTSA